MSVHGCPSLVMQGRLVLSLTLARSYAAYFFPTTNPTFCALRAFEASPLFAKSDNNRRTDDADLSGLERIFIYAQINPFKFASIRVIPSSINAALCRRR